MSKLNIKKILITTLLTAVLSWLWIKRKRTVVPAEKIAKKFLVKKSGSIQTDQLLEQYRKNYKDLCLHFSLPKDRVLQFHLRSAILPVLAFYQVLLPMNKGDRETTIAEITEVVRDWILRMTRNFLVPLRYIPDPFRLFKPGFDIVMKLFPPSGFDTRYLEKSEERIAFDINRCFYLNTLTRYGVPELTTVFCAADEAMAELFPSSIEFQRTQTLGRGGSHCDFQYCNKS